jgi:hypothetical protein
MLTFRKFRLREEEVGARFFFCRDHIKQILDHASCNFLRLCQFTESLATDSSNQSQLGCQLRC